MSTRTSKRKGKLYAREEVARNIAAILDEAKLKSERKRLPVQQLKATDPYHRKVTKRAAELIAETWNKNRCDDLIVTRENGHYEVIDGNHRKAAMEMLGINHCYCRVYDEVPRKLRAALFLSTNTNKKDLRGPEKFSAGVMSGESNYTGVVSILKEYGFYIPMNPNGKDWNSIHCTNTLLEIHAGKDGPAMLRIIMRVISTAWDESSAYRTSRSIISGLHYLLTHKKYIGLVNVDHLIESLSKRGATPRNIIGEGELNHERARIGTSVPAAMCDAIVSHYNKGLSASKRLPSVLLEA